MSLRVAELETLFTADIKGFEVGATRVEARRKGLSKDAAEVRVEADARAALASMDRVESSARGLPDAEFTVDADVDAATRSLGDIEDAAGESGKRAGEEAGGGLSSGIIAAIATIPIAGAVVGIGAAIGKSLMDGLEVEVRSDRLMATTGLDPETVGRLARAAGEAYADNWGESIAANMDTARRAIQDGLLDPTATSRDAQKIITSLAGVADIIGGDISRTSQAAATLIRTGLAQDAAGAFDIIVRGFQAGNDKAEDWLDTLIEYPAVLTRLGLTGADATGLIAQGLEAGARNADFVADALKEFQIRATDASVASAEGYRLIGLSAEDMTAKIAAGGEGAREGLDEVLDGLRAIEDPVARNAAAVALFGTKAEDLGDALFAMDLTTAANDLGTFEGAAKSALDTISDNAASDIASAQRNIEVAADGIKGALAAAFNPQIEGFATFVAENREAVMGFLLGIANGGLDAARGFVEFTAISTEAIGSFISGPLADLADSVADVLDGLSFAGLGLPGAQNAAEDLRGFVGSMREVKDATSEVAENIRTNLITNGIDPAQRRLNEVAIPLIAQAAVHDASVRLASSIDSIGYAADGSAMQIELMGGELDTSTESGRLLDEQIQRTVRSLWLETEAARSAGETQEDLTGRYTEGRDALIAQLEAMGLTRAEAESLAAAYGAVPGKISTAVVLDTLEATNRLDEWVRLSSESRISVKIDAVTGNEAYWTDPGNPQVMRFEAQGDILTASALSPMAPLAQMVPPGTLRVVGDRLDVDESYIPLDGSARSHALLAETIRRMPGWQGMADGGVLSSQQAPLSAGPLVTIGSVSTLDVDALVRTIEERLALTVALGSAS